MNFYSSDIVKQEVRLISQEGWIFDVEATKNTKLIWLTSVKTKIVKNNVWETCLQVILYTDNTWGNRWEEL